MLLFFVKVIQLQKKSHLSPNDYNIPFISYIYFFAEHQNNVQVWFLFSLKATTPTFVTEQLWH